LSDFENSSPSTSLNLQHPDQRSHHALNACFSSLYVKCECQEIEKQHISCIWCDNLWSLYCFGSREHSFCTVRFSIRVLMVPHRPAMLACFRD